MGCGDHANNTITAAPARRRRSSRSRNSGTIPSSTRLRRCSALRSAAPASCTERCPHPRYPRSTPFQPSHTILAPSWRRVATTRDVAPPPIRRARSLRLRRWGLALGIIAPVAACATGGPGSQYRVERWTSGDGDSLVERGSGPPPAGTTGAAVPSRPPAAAAKDRTPGTGRSATETSAPASPSRRSGTRASGAHATATRRRPSSNG